MKIHAIETLQVIFKIAERCNLNCPYCYYFSGADSKVNARPPIIRAEAVKSTAQFLAQACRDIQIKNVQVIFHGGEPTLVKPRVFDEICSLLWNNVSPHTNLSFNIQTNGVNLSDDWINQLKKHHVGVGVSMDGPAEYNDALRPDHMGRGSHARIKATLERLSQIVSKGELRPVGLVSVLNSKFDYDRVYDHFIEDLKLGKLNFLLPDCNQDALPEIKESIGEYGAVLCKLFDKWLEAGQQTVQIREIEKVLRYFSVNVAYRRLPEGVIGNQIVVIHSDGHVGVDDTFMPAFEWFAAQPTADVRTTTLAEWLSLEIFDRIRNEQEHLPEQCIGCKWTGICRGGDIENRFSRVNGFDNKSVYCDALLKFYDHVFSTLQEGEYPAAMLEAAIRTVEAPLTKKQSALTL